MSEIPSLPLGIIGCGNLGSALARGILSHPKIAESFPLTVYDRNLKNMDPLVQLGAKQGNSAKELVESCTYIIIAVNPDQVFHLLQDIKAVLTKEKVIISVAAGISLAMLDSFAERSCSVAIAMPNTLVEVSLGFFGLCLDDPDLSDAQKTILRFLFSNLGKLVEIPEDRLSGFTALAACGPAYVYYFAESLIEAGVFMGMDRDITKEIVLSLFQGCAILADKSSRPISVLRDEVTTPGGSTVTGTCKFDSLAVRGRIIEGVLQAYDKHVSINKQ